MASILNPYIAFGGNAREAMEFYRSVFGGELTLSTFGDYGAAGEQHADGIMHALLKTDAGYTLMASDTPPGSGDAPTGGAITVSISGDDADQLRGYWTRLSEGGSVEMPLEKQMWGDEFGMCTDRFGIAWMVNISQPAG